MKAICPWCGRYVRVKSDGGFFKHLMKRANSSRAATRCPNIERDLPDRLKRFSEDGEKIT